uniref:TraB domain-containing protein n=1 Tax=Glossina brevipalpis TaxID=37001 RepID=A0A1A9W7M6_9MUSC
MDYEFYLNIYQNREHSNLLLHPVLLIMALSASPNYITKIAAKKCRRASNKFNSLRNNGKNSINSTLCDNSVDSDGTKFLSLNVRESVSSNGNFCSIKTSSISITAMNLKNSLDANDSISNETMPYINFTRRSDDLRLQNMYTNMKLIQSESTDTSISQDDTDSTSDFRLKNMNVSIKFNKSESTDTVTSQEGIGLNSRLTAKMMLKTNHPKMSILKINKNVCTDEDIANSAGDTESSSDEESAANIANQRQITLKGATDVAVTPKRSPRRKSSANASNKIRRNTESLLQSRIREMKLSKAGTFPDQSATPTSIGDLSPANSSSVQSQTKRPLTVYDTVEEFEANLPSTVTVLNTPFGSKVYLIGTTHFSEESQDDVSFVIRNVRPDVVMVELCPTRMPILNMDEKSLLEDATSLNLVKIRSIFQTYGCISGLFFMLLLQMSAHIAKDLGTAPGGEFRRALKEIQKLPGCMLHLGDRPIGITLHRALHALSFWQTIKFVWRLTGGSTPNMEEVEDCKQQDLLETVTKEMAGEFPGFSNVFIRERDLFLCHSLQLAALPQSINDGTNSLRPVRVVGIVGVGHANGISEMWGHVDPQEIPTILEIPPTRLSTRVCKYATIYGLISLAVFGMYNIVYGFILICNARKCAN